MAATLPRWATIWSVTEALTPNLMDKREDMEEQERALFLRQRDKCHSVA